MSISTFLLQISENIENAILNATTKQADKDNIKRNFQIHNLRIGINQSPSEKGEKFGILPHLCMIFQGELELVEPETFLDIGEWDLLDHPAELPNFRIEEKTHSFAIDIDGKKLSYKTADEKDVVNFNESLFDLSTEDLVGWLDRELRQVDVSQSTMMKFIASLINNLTKQPGIGLTVLFRNKYPLSRAIKDTIKKYRQNTQKKGYQQLLLKDSYEARISDNFEYEFKPTHYPARPPYYSGRYKFQKHFFPNNLIEDLKSKGEEFECAKAIDNIPEIKYWIRNLVRRDQASFWLPLAHNNFYPDFICELKDGRMLVVEYKGDAYATNDDSAEKRAIGNLWAEISHNKCLFIMAVKEDKNGRDVRQQILEAVKAV